MNYYLKSTDDVLKEIKSQSTGLTSKESEERLLKNGKNKLKEAEKESLITRFFFQMKDPMTIILLCAATISGITAAYAHESFADVLIILAVVIINAILGVTQESKAEKAIEALQEMAAATSKVLRDGVIQSIKSEDLVVGDVILLEAGDAIPADARLLESASLKVEEAALTGESVPVNKKIEQLTLGKEKDIPLGDRKNMVYMGSVVVYGRGTAVITANGMDTEMGKIADALANAKEGRTPLQIKLAQLSKILTILVVGICVFIFGFSLLTAETINGEVALNTFMVAVSLAVAAIPEGLATVVTIVLSIGVTNMSKKNAVIRKLTAVETLGCAQIICSDKTGTLTQNKMTVVDHFGEKEDLLATAMALCSDAQLDETNNAVGEPTECALVNYATKLYLDKNKLIEQQPRIAEAPFDSVRKMMSTIHKTSEGIVQYTKGAPDEVLKCCTHALSQGKVVPLTNSIRNEILAKNKEMADKALRVLAAAYRNYDSVPNDVNPENLEKELVFIGLTGMIDPIRPEVVDAIAECKKAGIRPIMITGDHRDTAVAIATQLGIIQDAGEAITGSELNEISDEAFKTEIERYSVYARVQPEHKVRIVNAWRAKGMITAMTGDGVNDAPSIKSADIGIGMGITGTDVTKNVADMVLADDNFASIVSAVGEGRRIYDNIRKCIQFLLSSNLSEVLSIFVATILGFTILKPVHLLWINLITDCFPALALGVEKAENDIMERKPRSTKDGIFADRLGVDVLYQGIMVTIITLAAYFIGHYMEAGVWEIANSEDGMTMAFLTMSMAEIFHSFNLRSQRKSILHMKHHNIFLIAGMALSLILTTAVIYLPGVNTAFGFEHISVPEYLVALGLAFLIVPIVEVVKFLQRKFGRN
ncbi:cation-translocating P-type ATPase [Lachnoclostridium phytofermentans]|uniref:P-type Ca(2+) transporter n=1 Tax=Lachnoclostridium phytofermentans (strain ATCC 700394 / DSM 18823 / ISDg) TaxID=357809 RepID=A9KJ20_LACP7|nr:cation-translocating P-type ATPase [Lachnoclostridium phytofermentans]ABX41019.1 ATPase, P-type (transporting), HAD superfamily, subfamily IC [Lachnoclostridium phytofermentans ISDg]